MMSRILIQCLLLTVWLIHLDCEVYQNRPKIKTSDGDLIIEPAFDKNIYLLPNGPNSNIFVGEVNILKSNIPKEGGQIQPATTDNSNKYILVPHRILERLERLENQTAAFTSDLLYLSSLWRKVNNLHRKVTNLQSQLNDRARDECESNPCQHGGTCLNLINGHFCMCPSNWEGRDCDVDVNECRNFAGTDLGCQNSATCINRPGSYECMCRSGWFGLHCTRKKKDCSEGNFEMCGHGTCLQVKSGEGITCLCYQGWTTNGTGEACLTDINECDSQYLGNRCSANPEVQCINLPGSFRCGPCPSGYEGDGFRCHDIDECITIANGGCSPLVSCHNTIGSRICGSCPPGYQGDGITCSWRGSCNINRGGCHPSAQCLDNGLATQCICPEGMDGDGVGFHGCYIPTDRNFSEPCLSNPCGIHGQCHTLRSGYTCICFKEFSGAHCDVPVNYCTNNPCQNGGTCRRDDSSSRGFRCECVAQYTGPLCQVLSRTCGGVLDNDEGSIVYPPSNISYSHNAKCLWVIHTTPDKVINVTFSKFNLEDNADCLYDFLQIHDGRSSANQLIGRFCGSNYPKGGNIISSHNNLYFWFRSDGSVAKDGFALHWTSIAPVCGGEVDATNHGQIYSPGSPGKYPPNRDCYWHLSTSLGKRIQLTFFALDIETHPNCSYDHLSIYDGEHTSDPLLNRYCNSTQPAPVESAGSDVLIHFHSDAYGSGNGFQIAYVPVQGVPGCGGFFTQDVGEISSPSFNGSYLNNVLCEYKIKTSSDTKIQLEFKSFALEYAFRCKYDYLKIYDGPSADSRLVGKFCGRAYPKSFTSSTNQLYFKFKTDRTLNSDGFRILYKTVCQMNMMGDSGIIKSPGYPFSYPENRICEYFISSTPGKAIQLAFQDFDLEDNRYFNCRYDYVEIRDGPNGNSTLLGRYCGGSSHTPPVQTSTHNYMYIRFKTDMSITGTGFYANYTTIDSECGGIYRESTGLINFPSGKKTTYENNQNCTWILIAPEGMHIKLTWNRFDIERMTTCDSDYLKIIEIDNSNEETVLGKYCGRNPPPAFTASSNTLKLLFASDSSIRSAGFSLSYSFLDERTHCGGTFIKSHGVIYSPGWPKFYDPNRDCTWVITVPVGQQIKLNISDFDLERPIRDHCDLGDHLSIRNGATVDSPLFGKFCGRFKSKHIVSLSNSLFMHFHSDFYLTGKGFKIEWDGTLTGCGGTLTGFTGTISSPNYPNNYNENAECFYRIITSQGSRLRISFTDLDLERTHKCSDDYVEIFDGRDVNTPSLGRHCTMAPELNNIETSSNVAYIKFRSDFLVSYKGFLLNYNTICHNNVTGSYGVLESPGYPNNYQLNLNCLWTITVPKGNKINVTYTHFDIYKPYRYRWLRNRGTLNNCSQDYVQFKESTDVTFSDKHCGTTAPPPFTTRSNSFTIEFITSSYVSRSGFQLEWVSYGCGAHIQKESGMISLDKSLVTTEEMECEWLIETSVGTGVHLAFNEVFMAESKNCTDDALEIYNGQSIKSPLLTKICHRTTAWVRSSSNYMLVRFVKHSSMKDIQFKANFESSKSLCGGKINALSGFIYSKNYPKNYDTNMNCIWSIHVPINHRIELSFVDLDLYSNDEDDECGDSIKIYDSVSMSSNYTYRVCPNSNTKQFLSKFNTLLLQFITDSEGTAKGFKANFTVTCGAVITALHSGILSNDKFVSHLSKNCSWTILAPTPDQKIYLTITHIALPQNNDLVTNRSCASSYLRVFDGDDNKAPLVDEYCGRLAPPMIVSHGSAITIELGTYGETILGHFSAQYSPFTNTCGGTLTSEEGIITSPNYPRSYPVNADCEWILSTSPGNRVYITFGEFHLDYSDGCNEDYLEVRENNGGGKILGVYCGDQMPTNSTSAAKIYVKFHSNNIDNERGFLLHYGFLHGSEINGQDSGEITSPLYPSMYVGSSDYSWRIVTSGTETITVTIDRLEMNSYRAVCYNKLSIYDGDDENAQLLEELCGLLGESKVIVTTSSAVYITFTTDQSNTGSIFHLRWAKSDIDVEEVDDGEEINCGSNKTELILPGKYMFVTSPNFPENYNNDLYCEWIFKSTAGRHLKITFHDFILEETNACFADSVSVYSADKLKNWKAVINNVCLLESVRPFINGTNYMKLNFKTDSSVTKKGFRAQISSICGGLITDLSSSFGPTSFDTHIGSIFMSKLRCDWIIKVRPGRQIKFEFEHFNITNTGDNCINNVVLRNGDSIESPMLGNGKYCGYSHESRQVTNTSGNSLFVSYIIENVRYGNFQNFIIRYEELNVDCGGTLTLGPDRSWEVISSPNYPNGPIPYTACEWVILGPPGEIIRVDFIDRFDIYRDEDCATEAVEVRDGSSKRSPLKGKFCHNKPGTVKTTNNVAYIRYLTERAEPNNGFKANISIDVCGGTIVARNGELQSPGYPHMQAFPYGTYCEWHIIGNNRHIFQIKPEVIHLPDSEARCDTKITIEEVIPPNNTMTILKTYCNEDNDENFQSVQTSTNNVTIRLHIGKPSKYVQNSGSRGFRFTFNSSMPECGGMINTPEGFLVTPSYPFETTLRYCHWFIKVPDESRKVRLEIIDLDIEKHRIGIFNDFGFQSTIQIIPNDDYTIGTNVFESTGHRLAIYLWLSASTIRHRFKAKFSSSEKALCGGNLSNVTGELVSPDINGSYYCEWKYETPLDNINNDVIYKGIYITAKVNSSVTRNRCRYNDPMLSLISYASTRGFSFIRDICGKEDVSYRIPLTVLNFRAIKSKSSSFHFHANWKAQPCGGTVAAAEIPSNIIIIPNSYNDTLDCAWAIQVPFGSGLELKLEGYFKLECEDEFIYVRRGLGSDSPILFEYCKEKMQEQPVITHFGQMYVEYHSKSKNNTNNVMLTAKGISSQCGRHLSMYDTTFSSPNFPKSYKPNEECTWEIKADLGYRISLHFIERFVIEDHVNCTKDAVIIYDWKDDTYIEIARLCGRQLPMPYNSTYNKMKVVLRTDADINLDGFKAQWAPICGGTFVATEKNQIIYSPGYPHGYPSVLDCSYEITAPNENIFVKFDEFELEGNYPSCEFDNLTIIATSRRNYFKSVNCGHKVPTISEYFDRVYIDFKTDRYIRRKGFKLTFTIYTCGGNVKNATVLSSSHFEYYANNLDCTWLIEAPINNIVVLKFNYIDLESDADCDLDYLAAYNGLSIDDDKRIALLCGLINSTTVLRSSNNTMALHFETDSSIINKGFKVEVYFSYSEAVGCGGIIDMTSVTTRTLKSPFIGNSSVYENYLDCFWEIRSPVDTFISIEFTLFHISPCRDFNQTALGYSKCDCDLVEIKDGVNPNSLTIGTYCGHTFPPQLVSSKNTMSVRLSTDGEIASSGFNARLTVRTSLCGKSMFTMGFDVQRFTSPGYDTGSIPRGLHCSYHFDGSSHEYDNFRLTLKYLDLQPPTTDVTGIKRCDKDKLIISSTSMSPNTTLGKDFILNQNKDTFVSSTYRFDIASLNAPVHIEICGHKESMDFYVSGSVTINLITSAEPDSLVHKGVEIEAIFAGFCGRNYTETQGRIKSAYGDNIKQELQRDCYTLITAPENSTISIYFRTLYPIWNSDSYLDFYDGNNTNSPKLISINSTNEENYPVFSNSRYVLIHNHEVDLNVCTFDLTYTTTEKGKGCGGKINNVMGAVTSPLYPYIYRRESTCEWELETPLGTRIFLKFHNFDISGNCDMNYLKLVDSEGKTISTFCSEEPAGYTSTNNYVKIVYVTSRNNGGIGWNAEFLAIV